VTNSVARPHFDRLVLLLLALSIVRLWLMPLPSSFWVDEMATVFVARFGAHHPSLAPVAPQAWESLYYYVPRSAGALFGFSEVVYRLPSTLALAAALFLVARLAARLIHPQAAWFAVFACLAMRGFDYQAADARPYPLGTCLAAASLWFLIEWLDSARWLHAALFVVCAALLWRVHLVFWPFYAVLMVYALVRLAGRDTSVPRIHAAAVLAVLGAALLPVLADALPLYHDARAHVVVALPGARDLATSLKYGLIAVCGVGAWLLARVFGWPPVKTPPAASYAAILTWWLSQPLGLFAFSWLTGISVFVSRYLSLSLPGAALVGTALAARFIPPARLKPAAAALGLGVLLLNGQWSTFWPLHHNSDWRTAVFRIRAVGIAPDTPVICPSPFIEARPPVWSPDYPLPGFLYSHLLAYPIPGKPYLFPFQTSPEAEAFATRLATRVLPVSGRFVLYGAGSNVRLWRDWFARRPELAGWNSRSLGPFRDVDVVVFEDRAGSAQ